MKRPLETLERPAPGLKMKCLSKDSHPGPGELAPAGGGRESKNVPRRYEAEVAAVGMLHAALVEASIGCGDVLSVDATQAIDLPGFAATVNASRWDCTLEPLGDERFAVRLGLRMVRGLANKDG